MRRRPLVASVLAALALAPLAGCGDGDGGGDASGMPSGGRVATIGVIAPTTGDLSPFGLGIVNSVDLAVAQANESGAVPGWTLRVAVEDDLATPGTGKDAATSLAAEPEVVAVVGTVSSAVAQAVQPVLADADIAMVSPANTSTSLTRGQDYASDPKRPFASYFRTCATDATQGPVAARYLEKAGVTTVVTVDDGQAYGKDLVAAFTKAYEQLGGTVAGSHSVGADDTSFDPVIDKLKSSPPGAVYFGGEYPQIAPFTQQLTDSGVDVPVMGGDAMYASQYIELAGSTANGDLATSVGAPAESLKSAKPFEDAYADGGYSEPAQAYGPFAYDAANAIIAALEKSLADADTVKDARKPTVEALADVSFDGATGKVAFDEYGDTTNPVVTVYEVRDGAWQTKETVPGS